MSPKGEQKGEAPPAKLSGLRVIWHGKDRDGAITTAVSLPTHLGLVHN